MAAPKKPTGNGQLQLVYKRNLYHVWDLRVPTSDVYTLLAPERDI